MGVRSCIFSNKKDKIFVTLICFIFVLSHVVSLIVHPIPHGTDVFGHLFYTRIMSNVHSLSDFYRHCISENYLGYDYPFGVWLFGSIVVKITTLDVFRLGLLFPLINEIIIIIIFYIFVVEVFELPREKALLSIVFLLSMTSLCMRILEYTSLAFFRPFLLFLMYLVISNKIPASKRAIIVGMLLFFLCFTHTGTYLFFTFFMIVYLFVHALLNGNFKRDVYTTIAGLTFTYIVTIHTFPHIHQQYIDKGTFVLSIGNFISSLFHVPFPKEVAQIFYSQIFVDLNPIYAAIICILIYGISELLIIIRLNIKEILSEKVFQIVSILGTVKRMPHTIWYAPFWLGPIHVIFAAFGLLKVNRRGLCLFLAVTLIALLPGYLAEERAVREIEYFYIVIPPLAAIGFYNIKEKIEPRIKGKFSKFVVGFALFGVFSAIVLVPVISNFYYHPLISGTKYERSGLGWLSTIGTPDEGCAGCGYRYMISIYANKEAPGTTSVAKGSEARRFSQDYRSIHFLPDSEKYAKDLYANFGVSYIIVSDRVLNKCFRTTIDQLKIDYNKQFDRIYSSIGNFIIYKYVEPIIHRISIEEPLIFSDVSILEDAGDSYLVKTRYYKVRIGKETPIIKYIGNETTNFLGEGFFYDFVVLKLTNTSEFGGFALQELKYSSVLLGENQIFYKTTLENKTKPWATLIVKYTFLERAIKRDIIVANDWLNSTSIKIRVSTKIFTPLNYFILKYNDIDIKKRRIYPCEDYVTLRDKFNEIYIYDDSEIGFYIKYEETSPHPTILLYSGSTRYKYYSLEIKASGRVLPSEALHLSQWISIGDEQTAKSNIERYTSISLHPYPNGEVPFVILSYADTSSNLPNESLQQVLEFYERMRNEIGVSKLALAMNLTDADMNELVEQGIEIVESGDIVCNKRHNGFLPVDLKYDLNTVKTLMDRNYLFIIGKKVLPPLDPFFQEGLRNPKTMYYHGSKTGLILLPVSEPIIPGPTYFYSDYLTAWKAVVDSAAEHEDMCILLWDFKKGPQTLNDVLAIAKYAKEKGMTFATPSDIAKHFKLLQNVSAVVSQDPSKIVISVTNNNDEAIHGVTFKIKVKKDVTIDGGSVVRIHKSQSGKIYYVSIDIPAKGVRHIILKES